MKPKPPTRRRASHYHHGDLRRALLDAALQEVARHGVDAVTMRGLSQRLRVSVAAPFRHFESREALLVAAAEEGVVRMIAAMDAAAARASARTANDALEMQRARGVAYVRFVVEDPGAFALLSRAEILAASPLLRASAQQQQQLMEPILGKHHQGRASAQHTQRAAGFLAAQALTYGLARMIGDGLLGAIDANQAEALAQEVTGVLGEGLIPRVSA